MRKHISRASSGSKIHDHGVGSSIGVPFNLPEVSVGRRGNPTASSGSGNGGLIGLANLGNTCFMNSALQCLLHISPLTEYFRAGHYNQDLNVNAPRKGRVAQAYAKLVQDVQNASGSISPKEFKRVLAKFAPHLLDYQQQDCHEFVRFLLDNMSEDLCRKRGDSSATAAKPEVEDGTADAMNGLSLESASNGNLHSSPKSSKFSDRLRSEVNAAQHEGSEGDVGVGDTAEQGVVDALSLTQQGRAVYTGSWSAGSATPPVTKRPTNNSFRARASHAAASLLGVGSGKKEVVSGPVPIDQQATHAWNAYLRLNDSIVTDMFAGQIQSTIECLTCNTKSHTFDPFLDLSVPIPRPTSASTSAAGSAPTSASKGMGSTMPPRLGRGASALQRAQEPSACKLTDCLDKFGRCEILDDENLPMCEKCKKRQRSTKTMSIYRHPAVLVIHIMRFSYTTISRDKLETDVTFPAQGLDLGKYLSPDVPPPVAGAESHILPSPPLYDLVGVCHHSGGMGGGHYTSYVDTSFAEQNQWHYFNDARVTPADVSAVGGRAAYMLFYCLRK